MSSEPGGLTITIDDRTVEVEVAGGGSWTLPVGPLSLTEAELADDDPPPPESLTNALGTVQDHFDDVLRDAPLLASARSVEVTGRHAIALARLELGSETVPGDYELERADADEVFRTIVAESVSERLSNPGLEADDVETVVGTCCVVLAIMRRLDLASVTVASRAA